jgi:ATP-dependent RNA helicase SUPV3L1/SUV3
MTIDAHVRLLQDIYRLILRHGGKIPEDYMAKQVDHISDTLKVSGVSIDILSTRLSQIRTWTYCANKIEWMSNAQEWINRTRHVEDKLSDALHESLTARFIDRRTNALLKTIGAGKDMDVKILDDGQVTVDDHVIGQLDGLKFSLAESGSELENKALKSAAEKAVAPEVDRRLTSLCGGTHAIFALSNAGEIMWGGKTVGRIGKGGTVFNPDAELIGGELGTENLRHMAQMRMRDFLRAEVEEKLAPLKVLKDLSENTEVPADVRGIAFEIFENYGVLERKDHGAKIKALTQDMRIYLRQAGMVFGQYHLFLRDLMKPKPATLLSLLTSFGAGGDRKPFIPFAGMTSLKSEGEMLSDNYTPSAISIAGYAALGPRIIRLDILDRLSKLIRQAQELGHRNSFQIMQEMLSLLGSTLQEVRGVLTAMGFQSQEGEANPKELERIAARAAERQAAMAGKAAAAPAPTETTSAPNTSPAPAETAPKETAPTETASTVTAPASNTPASETASTPVAAPKPAPRPRRQLSIHHERETLEDGTVIDKPNTEFWFMPSRRQQQGQKNNRPNRAPKKFDNKARNNKNSERKPKTQNYQSGGARRRIEDSPFAALAALQKPKKD